MKATRIAFSQNLNISKLEALENQALLLGKVRSEVWSRYGSIAGSQIRGDRVIRDKWMTLGRDFGVSADAWKETLRDAFGDVTACCEAAKKKVRQNIYRNIKSESNKKEYFKKLKNNDWVNDKYLCRLMRKIWKHGENKTQNQIIVRSDNYTSFVRKNQAWIRIPGLIKGRRISIPLNTNIAPTGTLRLILRNQKVEVHYTVEQIEESTFGDKILGIDKGFTEAIVDSDGRHYGHRLGKILSAESDYLKVKYQRRSKIRAIALKKKHKADNIFRNNLGRKKLDARMVRKHGKIRTTIYNSLHSLVNHADTIVSEDLTSPINKKYPNKDINRRLSAWTKGVLATSLESVSQRRSSTLIFVNAAYTSQMDSRHGILIGNRKGKKFHCFDGVVLDADENAARNVLARLDDSEIHRWTPFQKVKSVLLKRTSCQRLGLLKQDSRTSEKKSIREKITLNA